MPRARDPNRDKAYEIYKSCSGKIDLVEIASQLNVSQGTVRGWKSKDRWDDRMNGTFRKNTERSKQKKAEIPKVKTEVQEAVLSVLENADLTDKQRLFCLLYVRYFNATKAYQKAYGCDYTTAASIGYRMLENDGVKKEIFRLKQNRLNREMLSQEDIFQKYMDIAFADITDYVEFGKETIPVMGGSGSVQIMDEETGEKIPLTKEVNTVKFRDSSQVDGTIITEIKQGKDGASIKLADRMKALQWLSEHMNLATEEQKARIERIKIQTEQLKRALHTDDGNEGNDSAVQIYIPDNGRDRGGNDD